MAGSQLAAVAALLTLMLAAVNAKVYYPRKEDVAEARRMTAVLEEAEQHQAPDRRRLIAQNSCAEFGGVVRVALLVADPGGFSGNAEAGYYINNLKGQATIPKNETVCGAKDFGTIMGTPVVVVLTGIGPITAALCVTELLQCRPFISVIVYAGTAGYSSQIGGVLNADGTVNPSTMATRYGDLCITPFAVNWECQQADWTQQCAGYPNVDFYPGYFFDVTADFLYGQCIFTAAIKASTDLATELTNVGRSNYAYFNKPIRTADVLAVEDEYWGNMTIGTGIKYKYKYPYARTNVYTSDVCGEIDAQFFFSGVPWDMSARNFTAILLNQAYNYTRTFTQKDVIAVNGEEGIGIAFAIQNYNTLLGTNNRVPYTFVRGASDFLHNPVYKVKDGSWRQIDQLRNFVVGYGYAIASYSSVVLTWLQQKCVVLVASNKIPGPVQTTCAFTIDYS